MISAWIFAPRARGIELLEHQEGRAFADHEAIAFGVIGTRRARGLLVAPAGGVQGVEGLGLRRAELLGAAGQHARLRAVQDGFIGVADGLTTRGAGAVGGDHAALHAEENADVGRGGVRHHADVRIRVHALAVAVEQHVREVEHVGCAADARAAGHAHLPVGQERAASQARVADGQLRGAHRELRDAAHAAQLLARPRLRRRERIARRRESRAHVPVALPLGHVAHGALPGAERGLDAVPVIAQRRDAAHAGDHDAAHQHSPPFTEITWRVT
jgi:hypothetical protein